MPYSYRSTASVGTSVYFCVVNLTQPDTEVVPHHPYTILKGAFVVMAISLIISGGIWWWQLTHRDTHIAGNLVATSTDSLIIMDARGSTTTVLITNTKHPKNTPDPTTLAPGTPLIVRGQFIDDATFEAAGIRPVGRRP